MSARVCSVFQSQVLVQARCTIHPEIAPLRDLRFDGESAAWFDAADHNLAHHPEVMEVAA